MMEMSEEARANIRFAMLERWDSVERNRMSQLIKEHWRNEGEILKEKFKIVEHHKDLDRSNNTLENKLYLSNKEGRRDYFK